MHSIFHHSAVAFTFWWAISFVSHFGSIFQRNHDSAIALWLLIETEVNNEHINALVACASYFLEHKGFLMSFSWAEKGENAHQIDNCRNIFMKSNRKYYSTDISIGFSAACEPFTGIFYVTFPISPVIFVWLATILTPQSMCQCVVAFESNWQPKCIQAHLACASCDSNVISTIFSQLSFCRCGVFGNVFIDFWLLCFTIQ